MLAAAAKQAIEAAREAATIAKRAAVEAREAEVSAAQALAAAADALGSPFAAEINPMWMSPEPGQPGSAGVGGSSARNDLSASSSVVAVAAAAAADAVTHQSSRGMHAWRGYNSVGGAGAAGGENDVPPGTAGSWAAWGKHKLPKFFGQQASGTTLAGDTSGENDTRGRADILAAEADALFGDNPHARRFLLARSSTKPNGALGDEKGDMPNTRSVSLTAENHVSIQDRRSRRQRRFLGGDGGHTDRRRNGRVKNLRRSLSSPVDGDGDGFEAPPTIAHDTEATEGEAGDLGERFGSAAPGPDADGPGEDWASSAAKTRDILRSLSHDSGMAVPALLDRLGTGAGDRGDKESTRKGSRRRVHLGLLQRRASNEAATVGSGGALASALEIAPGKTLTGGDRCLASPTSPLVVSSKTPRPHHSTAYETPPTAKVALATKVFETTTTEIDTAGKEDSMEHEGEDEDARERRRLRDKLFSASPRADSTAHSAADSRQPFEQAGSPSQLTSELHWHEDREYGVRPTSPAGLAAAAAQSSLAARVAAPTVDSEISFSEIDDIAHSRDTPNESEWVNTVTPTSALTSDAPPHAEDPEWLTDMANISRPLRELGAEENIWEGGEGQPEEDQEQQQQQSQRADNSPDPGSSAATEDTGAVPVAEGQQVQGVPAESTKMDLSMDLVVSSEGTTVGEAPKSTAKRAQATPTLDAAAVVDPYSEKTSSTRAMKWRGKGSGRDKQHDRKPERNNGRSQADGGNVGEHETSRSAGHTQKGSPRSEAWRLKNGFKWLSSNGVLGSAHRKDNAASDGHQNKSAANNCSISTSSSSSTVMRPLSGIFAATSSSGIALKTPSAFRTGRASFEERCKSGSFISSSTGSPAPLVALSALGQQPSSTRANGQTPAASAIGTPANSGDVRRKSGSYISPSSSSWMVAKGHAPATAATAMASQPGSEEKQPSRAVGGEAMLGTADVTSGGTAKQPDVGKKKTRKKRGFGRTMSMVLLGGRGGNKERSST